MRACSVLVVLVAIFAVANCFSGQVENIQFESPKADAPKPAGSPAVKLFYEDGDERMYPNEKDSDELDHDAECEDEPDVTHCPPPATLGVTTIAKVGDDVGGDVFGKARNDVGDQLAMGYADSTHGPHFAGGVVVPMLTNDVGLRVFGLTAIDGGANKVSSLYTARFDVGLNKSADLLMSAAYLDSTGAHGVLSPSDPRITPWCSSTMTEQIAFDADTYASGDTLMSLQDATDHTAAGFDALKDYHHARENAMGENVRLSEVTAWMYGWPVEAQLVDRDSKTNVLKRYALGRGNWDGMQCMPDGYTCLFWGEGHFFAFVMENKFGMDYGRLFYASKVEKEDGKIAISWMEMGRDPSDSYPEDEDEEPTGEYESGEQGVSLLHEDEVKEVLDSMTVGKLWEKEDGEYKHKKLLARLDTVRYAKELMGATDQDAKSLFMGLVDTTFAREFRGCKGADDKTNPTKDDCDRGTVFLGFGSTANADWGQNTVWQCEVGSFKDIEVDDDDEFTTSKATEYLPKDCVLAVSESDIDGTNFGDFASLAWGHWHNLLLIGTKGGAGEASGIIAAIMDKEFLAANTGVDRFSTVYEGVANTEVRGLSWNQNMIGNGDSYITFGISHLGGDMEGEWDIVGPIRMRGYLAGGHDQLMNLGCPRFDAEHYLHKEYVSQEWPLPEEDEDEED